jgi:hypothetical protein
MALEVTKEEKPKGFVLGRHLYLNEAKDKVVEEGDPEARFVLGGPGSTIEEDEVKRLGLTQAKHGGEAPQEEEDLSSHTVAELKEIAEEKGVDLSGVRLKDEIVAAIENGGEEEAEDDAESSSKLSPKTKAPAKKK